MIQFRIDAKLPSLNDYINKLKGPKGKTLGAVFKAQTDALCMEYMLPVKVAARALCKAPVLILCKWNEKSKRRDLDNVYSGKKYILDAMQKCGIIDNDNYTHIKGVYDTVIHGEKDFVTVELFGISELDNLLKEYTQCERFRIAQAQEELDRRKRK